MRDSAAIGNLAHAELMPLVSYENCTTTHLWRPRNGKIARQYHRKELRKISAKGS